MKMLKILFLSFVLFSLNSLFASTRSERTFIYDGSQDISDLILTAEQTHTEYRYERRRTTCYRRQVYYRNVCRNTPSGRYCQRTPYYRTISYPCVRDIRIPYEVKDFDVEANVRIIVENEALPNTQEYFKVVLDGDRISLSATGTKKYFLMLRSQEIIPEVQGQFKYLNVTYRVELVEARPILSALNMNDISYQDNALKFTTGPFSNFNSLGLALLVKKAPRLSSDVTLFDQDLSVEDMTISNSETSTEVSVNLNQLGIHISKGRYKMTAKIYYKYIGTFLNKDQFQNSEASRTLVYKIK